MKRRKELVLIAVSAGLLAGMPACTSGDSQPDAGGSATAEPDPSTSEPSVVSPSATEPTPVETTSPADDVSGRFRFEAFTPPRALTARIERGFAGVQPVEVEAARVSTLGGDRLRIRVLKIGFQLPPGAPLSAFAYELGREVFGFDRSNSVEVLNGTGVATLPDPSDPISAVAFFPADDLLIYVSGPARRKQVMAVATAIYNELL